MRQSGSLTIRDIPFSYWLMLSDVPISTGINGGKIQKLTLYCNGVIVCDYNCGFMVEPTNKFVATALEYLIEQYN